MALANSSRPWFYEVWQLGRLGSRPRGTGTGLVRSQAGAETERNWHGDDLQASAGDQRHGRMDSGARDDAVGLHGRQVVMASTTMRGMQGTRGCRHVLVDAVRADTDGRGGARLSLLQRKGEKGDWEVCFWDAF